MCSIEQGFDPDATDGQGSDPKPSVVPDRHLVMNTTYDAARADRSTTRVGTFPRRSQMSTIALAPGFNRTRTAPTRTAPRAATAARTTPTTRLTRRGRLVVLLAFVAVLLAAFTVLGDRSAATDEPLRTTTVEVGVGDTLWEIAADVAGPGQVRDMVYTIEELNALDSSALQVGQLIVVPAG